MKHILISLSAILILWGCKPTKELSKYVLKNKLSQKKDTYVESLDYIVLYKKADKKNKSFFEITSYVHEDHRTFLFCSDSIIGDISSPNFLLEYTRLNYQVIGGDQIKALKDTLQIWESRFFAVERSPAIAQRTFIFNQDFKVVLDFYNKPDLYYNDISTDSIPKNRDAYFPVLSKVHFILKGRRHSMQDTEFVRTFGLRD